MPLVPHEVPAAPQSSRCCSVQLEMWLWNQKAFLRGTSVSRDTDLLKGWKKGGKEETSCAVFCSELPTFLHPRKT